MKGYRVSKAKGKKIVYIYPNITEAEINLVKMFYVADGYELIAKEKKDVKAGHELDTVKKTDILEWLKVNDKEAFKVWDNNFNTPVNGKKPNFMKVKRDFKEKYNSEKLAEFEKYLANR